MTRRRILVALAIAALLIAAVEWVVRSFNLETMRGPIEQELSASLGLDVTLEGDLQLSLLPRLHLEAEDVRVANLPGRPSPDLFRAGRIELSLDLWPLLWERHIEIEALRLANAKLHLEPDAEGRLELPPGLTSTAAPDPASPELSLSLESLRFDDVKIFHRSGEGAPVTAIHVETLQLEADDLGAPMAVELRGDVDGSTYALTGQIGPFQQVFAPTQPFPIVLRGQVFEAEVELEGSIEKPSELRGLDLQWSLRLADLGREVRARGYAVPPLGALSVSGRAANPEGVLGLYDLSLRTEDDDTLSVEVSGEIRQLEPLGGVDLELRLTASDLDLLDPYVDRPLPEIDALHLTAHFGDADGSLGVEGAARATAHGGRLELRASGKHADVRQLEALDVQIEADASDVVLLAETLGIERRIPSLGPLRASGRLHPFDDGIALDDIKLSVGDRAHVWADADGYVHDLLELRGVKLNTRFGAKSGRDVAAFLGHPLPEIGAFEANALVSDLDGTLGVSFKVAGGRVDVLRLNVEGDFDDVRNVDEISFQMQLQAHDLSVLGSLMQIEQPRIGPVEFKGRVSGSDERLASTGEMRIGETSFSGRWTASFPPGQRPRVKATVHSEHVRMEDTGFVSIEGEPLPEAPPLFSEGRKLPFDDLRDFDGDLELRIDRLTSGEDVEIKGLRTAIRLEDGLLTIRDFSASYATGNLVGGLRIDVGEEPPQLALFLDATQVNLQQLADLIPGNQDAAGIASVWLDLNSSGRSPRQLRDDLSGSVSWVLRDGTLTSHYAQKFVTKLVGVIFPSLLPNVRPKAPVECFRAAVALEHGIASVDSFMLKGATETVHGSGKIDLVQGHYDLLLTPTTSQPGLLSVAAQVEVVGPLDDPQFRPVKRTIALSAARSLISTVLRPARAVLSPATDLMNAFRGGAKDSDREACEQPLVDDREKRRPSWVRGPASESRSVGLAGSD